MIISLLGFQKSKLLFHPVWKFSLFFQCQYALAILVLGDCHGAGQQQEELEFPTSSWGDSYEFQKSQLGIDRLYK